MQCGSCGSDDHPLSETADGIELRRPEGELKLVTVLFADLSGFTGLSERLSPDELEALVDRYFEQLARPIEEFGGSIDKFIGDAVLALFGAPVAHENDSERALEAALAMRQAIEELNHTADIQLEIHIGVNTGLVSAGSVGTAAHSEYSVVGDAVNVGARLAELAPGQRVFVGAETRQLADRHFRFADIGSVLLKGKSEAVQVFELLGRRARHTAADTLTVWLRSPLVGREEEMRLLGEAVEGLEHGVGSIVAVLGEAGIGKSRLLVELRPQLDHAGIRLLEGRSTSFGKTMSYRPFVEIVEHWAEIDPDHGEGERWTKLHAAAESLFPDAAAVLPSLAALLSIPLPPPLAERVRRLDPDSMGRQLFRAVRRLLSLLAVQGPLMVVFEDAHWMDLSSAALVEHCLPLVHAVPLLIAFVSRVEAGTPTEQLLAVAGADHSSRFRQIELNALTGEQTARLVSNLAPAEDMPNRLAEQIRIKADGNPFFVEEAIRTLVATGGLVRERGGHWRVTPLAAGFVVPDSLKVLIAARVDRLDDDVKRVLTLAAVIGQSFFYRVLAAIAEEDEHLERKVGILQTHELVREKCRLPELEYIFKHALVQEVTYGSILAARRRLLHQRVAGCIEELFADRLDEFASLLAYHYSKAQNWEKARGYLLRAGDQAGRIAADAEALVHYEQAMEAHAVAFGDSWDPIERASLERKIGEALYRRADYVPAGEHLQQALAQLGTPFPDSARALRTRLPAAIAHQFVHRLTPGFLRRPTLSSVPRVVAERDAAYWALTDIQLFSGDIPRYAYSILAKLNAAEDAGFTSGTIESYSPLANLLVFAGACGLGRRYQKRAVELCEREGDLHARAVAHLAWGAHEFYAAHWEECVREGRQAAELSLLAGSTKLWTTSVGHLCMASIEQGEPASVLPIAREMLSRGEDEGNQLAISAGHAMLGEALLALDDYDAAARELELAANLAAVHQNLLMAARWQGFLGHALLLQDKLEEARVALEDRERIPPAALGPGVYTQCVHTGRVALELRMAEDSSGTERAQALAAAERAFGEAKKKIKVCPASQVPLERLAGTRAWLMGSRKRAERHWARSVGMAEKLGCRYQGALSLLEWGRRLDDAELLTRAETELRAVRAG